MSQKNYSISVFFPCYNDENTIGQLVTDSFIVLKKITTNYEVIVVDDGSTDKSRELLKNLAVKNKNLKLIFHEKNKGYGGALQSGFQNSTKDLIFYTDGDGQYDISELTLLYSLIDSHINFVNGIKASRHDSLYRVIIGNLYNFFIRWLFWTSIIDVDCDFRLIKRDLIIKIALESKSGAVCIELVKKAEKIGAQFRQITVTHSQRMFGSSQFFKPRRILETFYELVIVWFKVMLKNN